jgi:hypothetical protein
VKEGVKNKEIKMRESFVFMYYLLYQSLHKKRMDKPHKTTRVT